MIAFANRDALIRTLGKGRFPVQPYRSETRRILLFCKHSGRTSDMDTKEYALFCYDTVEMENSLKPTSTKKGTIMIVLAFSII